MKGYLQALLNEDIYYDEANPKYRCTFNLYHVAVSIYKLLNTYIFRI